LSATLILVRHAPTQLQEGVRAAEWRLTADARDLTSGLARQLAALAANRADGEAVTGAPEVILTSHEPKAIGTGRWLAAELGVSATAVQGLEEHHRRRSVTLLDEAEWHRTLRRFFANPDVLLFGEETASEARQRFAAALRRAQEQRPGKRLAVVSHGTVMALLLAAANDLPAYDLWRGLKMPEAFVLDADLRIVRRLAPDGAR
jgi:broad specificity phosphatase PhoE